ncbi:MAG: hypothetical protein ACRENO_06010 [Thermodesulfobacteriota bacterium]
MNNQDNIYFTIVTAKSGFTDKLNQFNAFYRLGCNMGFNYYHTDFISFRSSNSVLNEKPTIISKIHRTVQMIIRLIKYYLLNKYYFEIFNFIGFNDYLKSKNRRINPKSFKKIDIVLDDKLILEEMIESVDDFKNYINRILSNYKQQRKMIIFRVEKGGRKLIKPILLHIPAYPDQLGLRAHFFKIRQKHKRNSNFNKNKIKVLVHIRKGDTAFIKTPWNTYIQMIKDFFIETKNITDLTDNNYVNICDFKFFIEKIISLHSEDKFSTLIFSDGFERAFSIIYLNMEKLNFTKHQINQIMKTEKFYNKKQFEVFENIRGTKLIVGETDRKLKNLIFSVLEADIVVIGTKQGMIKIFLENYFDITNMPIVVVLFRGNHPQTPSLNNEIISRKFIFVDVDNSNDDKVFSRLNLLLKEKNSSIEKVN